MKKKILALILCVISLFCFAGCGSVKYIFQVDSKGVVTQQVIISYSKSDVESAGFECSNVNTYIQNKAINVIKQYIQAFEDSHNDEDVLETYGDEQASFAVIRNYVYQNINFATRDFFGNIHVNQSVISWSMSSDSKNYVCTITLQFSTIYAYCYFNDIYPNDEEDTSNKVTEDYAFFYKTTTTSKSPFYNLSSKQITADFLDYFGGNFALSDMTFSFCYSTYDTKMYSDATKTYTLTNGNVVHQWDYTAEQLAEENGGMYSTYTIKIKPYVWYLSAIVISLLVALVLVIVVKVKEHNKKSKSIAIDAGIVEAATEDVTVTKANQTEDKE